MDYKVSKKMEFNILQEITDGFSTEIGRGAFGVVYKGVTKDGQEIAVKMLNPMQGFDDEQFGRELDHLTTLEHPNIVRLLYYCDEIEEVCVQYKEKTVNAQRVHRALCLEYMRNGSLQNQLPDIDQGFGWRTRYKIIKGICKGLNYLHTNFESPIYHLDLKPANILLDGNMEPKITDFGLSRLLGESTRMIKNVGTLGYLPPEYITDQIISKEFDIFSLGIIIMKIIIGSAGYSLVCDMEPAEVIEHVVKKWRERLQVEQGYTLLKTECDQVRKCIEIALKCTNVQRRRRPTMKYVIDHLIETEELSTEASSRMKVDQKFDDEESSLRNNNFQERHFPEMTIGASRDKSLLSTLPTELPFQFLEEITNGFSDERKLSSGFGTDYKGVLQDGHVIIVKRLNDYGAVPAGKQFVMEATNFMAIEHENILKLLSYCREAQKKLVEHNGRYIIVDATECILCYEYASKGSIDKYIFDDTNSQIDWCARFKIIKGICKGLHFLHKELGNPIVHLDLQPANILLDDNMVAKIANFGLSRLFGEEQTQIYTINVVGARGYMAPEYLYRGEISLQCDIYSLGLLIIEISTGESNRRDKEDMSSRNFISYIRQTWTDEHIATKYLTLDATSLQQVKICIELGLMCVNVNRNSRPSILEIVDRLCRGV